MSIKLIIFDLDGTLIDSLKDIASAVNYAVKPIGLDGQSDDAIRSLVGGGISGLILSLIGEDRSCFMDEAVERFMVYYRDHIVDHTIAYDGVEGVLEDLSSCSLGVISNKREELVKKILSELGIDHFFGQIYGSDSASDKKPSPAPVIKMMDYFGATPGETIIVGDGEADIGAGQAAGILTVSVTYGYRTREQLCGADYYISEIGELPALINRI